MMLLAHLELSFLAQTRSTRPTFLSEMEHLKAESEGGSRWVTWVCDEEMGLGHTKKSFWRLGLGRSKESARITIPMACGLRRLPGGGFWS